MVDVFAQVTTEPPVPVVRRAGAAALVYALLSFVTASVLGVIVLGFKVVGIDPGLAGVGVDVGAVSAVIALLVGVVQRLAGSGSGSEPVPGKRIAAWACGVPLGLVAVAFGLLVKTAS
ncbi:MAG: hypothetical protein ACOH2F_01520 [Cellulomonas sp.]